MVLTYSIYSNQVDLYHQYSNFKLNTNEIKIRIIKNFIDGFSNPLFEFSINNKVKPIVQHSINIIVFIDQTLSGKHRFLSIISIDEHGISGIYARHQQFSVIAFRLETVYFS